MSILRKLRDEYREFPATMVLGTLWVLVFGVMVVNQAQRGPRISALQLVFGPFEGHPFGDLTIRELYQGEIWRTLTATFVHFGLLHIGFNLWALYQLGSLVESWYGSGPLVAVYVLTGGIGNLISGVVRNALRHPQYIHSGGGSTVIMGLVGLCAVVGWRSRTRIGEHLRRQMVWVLVVTAAMGAAFTLAGLPVIDNWGHAGGALVGAVIGLANRGIVRQAGRWSARLAGVLGTLALAASAFALVSDDRAEAASRRLAIEQARRRLATDERLIARLESIRDVYRTGTARRRIVRFSLVARRPTPVFRGPVASSAADAGPVGSSVVQTDPDQDFAAAVLSAGLKYLNSMTAELDTGSNRADFRRSRQLFEQTLAEPPTLDEIHEFDARLVAILVRLRNDRDAAVREQVIARAGSGRTD